MRQSNRNARFFYNWSFESNMQFVKYKHVLCSWIDLRSRDLSTCNFRYKKSVMAWEYPDGTPTMFLPTEDELQHGIKVVHSSRQPSGNILLIIFNIK